MLRPETEDRMRSNADLDISKFGTEDEADALIAECADRGLALDINGIQGKVKVGRKSFTSYAAALAHVRG